MEDWVDIGKEPICLFIMTVDKKLWDCVEVAPTFHLVGAYKDKMGVYSHLCVGGGDRSEV